MTVFVKDDKYVTIRENEVDQGNYEFTRGEHWLGNYTIRDTLQPIDSIYIKNYSKSKFYVKDIRHYLIRVENLIETVCFELLKKKYLFDTKKVKNFIESDEYVKAMRALGLKEISGIKIQTNHITGIVIKKNNEMITLEQFIVDHLNTDVAHTVP